MLTFNVTLTRSVGDGESFGLGIGENPEGGPLIITEIKPGGIAERSGTLRAAFPHQPYTAPSLSVPLPAPITGDRALARSI